MKVTEMFQVGDRYISKYKVSPNNNIMWTMLLNVRYLHHKNECNENTTQDPVTYILKLDLHIVKMYMYIQNEFLLIVV